MRQVYWNCILMLCIKLQLQLIHSCCAGLFAPAYLGPWVVRVTCHAYSEAPGLVCAANCYNNTSKDCIVNLFCLVMDVASFRLVMMLRQCCWAGKLSIIILGKLIQFCRMKSNCVVL